MSTERRTTDRRPSTEASRRFRHEIRGRVAAYGDRLDDDLDLVGRAEGEGSADDAIAVLRAHIVALEALRSDLTHTVAGAVLERDAEQIVGHALRNEGATPATPTPEADSTVPSDGTFRDIRRALDRDRMSTPLQIPNLSTDALCGGALPGVDDLEDGVGQPLSEVDVNATPRAATGVAWPPPHQPPMQPRTLHQPSSPPPPPPATTPTARSGRSNPRHPSRLLTAAAAVVALAVAASLPTVVLDRLPAQLVGLEVPKAIDADQVAALHAAVQATRDEIAAGVLGTSDGWERISSRISEHQRVLARMRDGGGPVTELLEQVQELARSLDLPVLTLTPRGWEWQQPREDEDGAPQDSTGPRSTRDRAGDAPGVRSAGDRTAPSAARPDGSQTAADEPPDEDAGRSDDTPSSGPESEEDHREPVPAPEGIPPIIDPADVEDGPLGDDDLQARPDAFDRGSPQD